jgi:hypothetical protein
MPVVGDHSGVVSSGFPVAQTLAGCPLFSPMAALRPLDQRNDCTRLVRESVAKEQKELGLRTIERLSGSPK